MFLLHKFWRNAYFGIYRSANAFKGFSSFGQNVSSRQRQWINFSCFYVRYIREDKNIFTIGCSPSTAVWRRCRPRRTMCKRSSKVALRREPRESTFRPAAKRWSRSWTTWTCRPRTPSGPSPPWNWSGNGSTTVSGTTDWSRSQNMWRWAVVALVGRATKFDQISHLHVRRHFFQDMYLLCDMGPPGGGRQVISQRLQSRFNLINMTFPSVSWRFATFLVFKAQGSVWCYDRAVFVCF